MDKFLEISFPSKLLLYTETEICYNNSITSTVNGKEIVNLKWIFPRLKFTIIPFIKSKENMNDLISFFRLCKGKAFGFKFRDWSDFHGENELLGISDGKINTFKFIKHYKIGNHTNIRNITKPLKDSIKIFLNGSYTESSRYTIDFATGILSFLKPLKEGIKINASFDFDVPVRFLLDALPIRISGTRFQCGKIELIEIINE